MNTGNSSCRKIRWQGRFRDGWMDMPGLMSAPDRSGKRRLTIMMANQRNMRPMICQIMDTQIIGWKRGGYHRFSKEGFGTQRCWIREGKDETETVNQPDKDGFIKLTEGEQMKIPFD